MGECSRCNRPLHIDGVCMACEPYELIDDLERQLYKAVDERDKVTVQYHDGMKALLWLVQLHAKAEAWDEIEEALEVAEEKLAIWAKAREAK